MDKPLKGIRVLELSNFVAAPLCGRLMADMGAQVIKVERANGDEWRRTGVSFCPKTFSEEENPVYDLYNSGKQFVILDLKSQDGLRIFMQLLDKADVFLTNTRPHALQRLGISYEDLKEKYPRLIYAMLVGYGEKGPDADLPAFDVTAFWARSGFLRDQAIMHEHYTPTDAPSSAGDTVTGLTLLSEINAALLRRERTGKGDVVRAGLFHNGLFTFGTMQIIAQKPFGNSYPRQKGKQAMFCCSDDEWVMVGMSYALSKSEKLYQLIGHPEYSQDERFNNPAGRRAHYQELMDALADAFRTNTAEYWVREARRVDQPVLRLQHYSDAVQDEQAWANGYLEKYTYPNGHQVILPTSPIEMGSVGELTTTPAAPAGADTDAVLRGLGYSEDEIKKLAESGAVVTR